MELLAVLCSTLRKVYPASEVRRVMAPWKNGGLQVHEITSLKAFVIFCKKNGNLQGHNLTLLQASIPFAKGMGDGGLKECKIMLLLTHRCYPELQNWITYPAQAASVNQPN